MRRGAHLYLPQCGHPAPLQPQRTGKAVRQPPRLQQHSVVLHKRRATDGTGELMERASSLGVAAVPVPGLLLGCSPLPLLLVDA